MLKALTRSSLVRDSSKLISGAILGQVITLLAIPILTRMYSQEAFGIYAAFSAVVAFISSFATLKYDTALVLPKKDKSAYALLKLSNLVTLIITVLCVGILFLPFSIFEQYQGLQFFIALAIVFTVNINNSTLWNIRCKQYNHTSISKVIQASAVFASQYFIYQYYGLEGLVIGNVLGLGISGVYLIVTRKFDWRIYRRINLSEMQVQGKRYIDFPKYFTASNAILSFSSSLPIFLFVHYIPLAMVGLYGVALRIVTQPVMLIANNIRSVILSDMATKKNNGESILTWYYKIFFALLALSAIPSFVLVFFGDALITFILGEDWKDAALYAKMLVPLLIGQMIAAPAIAAVRVFELQKYNFKYSLISLACKAGILFVLFSYNALAFEYIVLLFGLVTLALVFVNNAVITMSIKKYEKTILTYKN